MVLTIIIYELHKTYPATDKAQRTFYQTNLIKWSNQSIKRDIYKSNLLPVIKTVKSQRLHGTMGIHTHTCPNVQFCTHEARV